MSAKCSKPGCNGWAKKGTGRCVFHPADLDQPETIAEAITQTVGHELSKVVPPPVAQSFTPPTRIAPSTRCNVCRAVIPSGTAGCPNAALHNPGYTGKGRR